MTQNSSDNTDQQAQPGQNWAEEFLQQLNDNKENLVDLRKLPCNDSRKERKLPMDGQKERESRLDNVRILFDKAAQDVDSSTKAEYISALLSIVEQLEEEIDWLRHSEAIGEDHPDLTQDVRKQEANEQLQKSFKLILDLPRPDALALLSEFQLVAEKTRKALDIDLPKLPAPDPTGQTYPHYPSRAGVDPLEFLEEHWGVWLKRFNPKLDRDYLFQDELRQRDLPLFNAIRGKLTRLAAKKGGRRETIKDYVSAKSARIEAEINSLPEYYRENANRLGGVIYRSKTP